MSSPKVLISANKLLSNPKLVLPTLVPLRELNHFGY